MFSNLRGKLLIINQIIILLVLLLLAGVGLYSLSGMHESSSQGAQQTATASEELARLAGQLHSMVGQFKNLTSC
jgi:flagellar basal body-associated protein FliL